MAQWVTDLALSLLWLWLQLWCGFDLWTKNFHMPWAKPFKITHSHSKPRIYREVWWGEKVLQRESGPLCEKCSTLVRFTKLHDHVNTFLGLSQGPKRVMHVRGKKLKLINSVVESLLCSHPEVPLLELGLCPGAPTEPGILYRFYSCHFYYLA